MGTEYNFSLSANYTRDYTVHLLLWAPAFEEKKPNWVVLKRCDSILITTTTTTTAAAATTTTRPSPPKILSTSVHNFLSNLANRQTDKQTEVKTRPSSTPASLSDDRRVLGQTSWDLLLPQTLLISILPTRRFDERCFRSQNERPINYRERGSESEEKVCLENKTRHKT